MVNKDVQFSTILYKIGEHENSLTSMPNKAVQDDGSKLRSKVTVHPCFNHGPCFQVSDKK